MKDALISEDCFCLFHFSPPSISLTPNGSYARLALQKKREAVFTEGFSNNI